MDALTPLDPALKREQMAAGGLYIALVAHINDPRTQIPFSFPLKGPIAQGDLDRLNERLAGKYVVTYTDETYVDADECPREKYTLVVSFAPANQ